MRDQQVEIAGAPDLRVTMVAGDQEERRQRHRFPGDHEEIGVVGHEHQGHAGEKGVVAQALHAGRCAFAGAEVSAGERRHAGGDGAEQQQKKRRQGIHPRVERQIGQPKRQHSHRRGGE
jgi:hypothetical protein